MKKDIINNIKTYRIKELDNMTEEIIRSRQNYHINKSFNSKSLIKIINQKLANVKNYTYICIS